MSKRLEHFKGAEELVSRLEDQMMMCQRQNRVIFTPFLSEGEGAVLSSLCGKLQPYASEGGYPSAQRRCYAFLPYEGCAADFPICILYAEYDSRFQTLTHRDVLGACMHQGIEREQIGDIIVDENRIYVAVTDAISSFLIDQIKQIKRAPVSFERFEGTLDYQVKTEAKLLNVSALRMDAVVAAICHVSRSKAAALIRGGMVKVNDLPLEQSSSLCHNNSTVSIRGYGRFQFIEVKNTTKKNRFVIEVKVYC